MINDFFVIKCVCKIFALGTYISEFIPAPSQIYENHSGKASKKNVSFGRFLPDVDGWGG